MANKLIKFEIGAGAGVVHGAYAGKAVIGPSFPASSSTDMFGVACDKSEAVYVSDSGTATIYKITEGGKIRILAGLPGSDGLVNGVGTAARFQFPKGIACDKSGYIYVADSGNNRVRKIDPNGKVTTLIGGFDNPSDVAVAPNGDVIVADTGNHKIWRVESGGRKLLVAGSVQGDVSGTVNGVKIKGNAARFNGPLGVACDNSGNIYVADTDNYQIKKIDQSGWVTLFAGSGAQANTLGNALAAAFIRPIYLAVNSSGELFVIDRVSTKNRLKRISPNGVVSTVGYVTGSTAAGTDGILGVAVSASNKVFAVTSDATELVESSSSSESSSSESSSSESSASSASSSSESSSDSSQS